VALILTCAQFEPCAVIKGGYPREWWLAAFGMSEQSRMENRMDGGMDGFGV